jgi:uncharacterized membrane protein
MKKMAWITSVALIALAFALSALFYDRLPDPVPTHWGLSGEADGFTPKPWGAFVLPLMMGALVALFALLPRISPRGFRMDEFAGLWRGVVVATMAFMAVIHGLTIMAALGTGDAVNRGVPLALGALFVLLGNYLPKVRRNFFMGIRTPWSLAHEEVWARTHRLGGKTFVAGGLLAIAGAIMGLHALVLAGLVFAAIVPVVYSYFACRAYEREQPNGNGA